jgi:hypothetical protein
VLPWVRLLRTRIWGPKYTGYHYDLKFSSVLLAARTVVCESRRAMPGWLLPAGVIPAPVATDHE